MRKLTTTLLSCSLLLSVNVAVADGHEAEEANVATPVEMFACKYNDGKGRADLTAATKKWNAWADKKEIDDYTAWTLVPYYSGPEQDFDVLWLGGSDTAKTLGRVQDMWIATGAKEAEAFADAITCDSHGAYAVLTMKKPPERENPDNVVISFSDCNMAEGVTFDDLYMPIMEWGEYTGENGSTGGMWVFFPSFGGGGEEFAFKFVTAYQNLEDMGAAWDQFSESGWQKANELFQGKLMCDSARTYLATNERRAVPDDE